MLLPLENLFSEFLEIKTWNHTNTAKHPQQPTQKFCSFAQTLKAAVSWKGFLNHFKPIFCKFEFKLEILCGALRSYLKVLFEKWRKSIFPLLIYYNFSSNSNFNLKFYVTLCIAIWKSFPKMKKSLFFWFSFVIFFLLIKILTLNFV